MVATQRTVARVAAAVGLSLAAPAWAQTGGVFDLRWNTYDGGGGASAGGVFSVTGTIGQPDAGRMTGTGLVLNGGFWGLYEPVTCYPNCDYSTTTPVLNVQDFTCFLQKFATGDPYANCDGSTTQPTLNVQDFTCFLQKFALGCP
jgi:hypothetical protein